MSLFIADVKAIVAWKTLDDWKTCLMEHEYIKNNYDAYELNNLVMERNMIVWRVQIEENGPRDEERYWGAQCITGFSGNTFAILKQVEMQHVKNVIPKDR